MPEICPVCNGLTLSAPICACCHTPMLDYGHLQSFLDPYAPFEEDELLHQSQTSVYEGYCHHFAYCSKCDRLASVKIELVPGPTSPL